MVCLGSDLWIRAPSKISLLCCNPHMGCIKADPQRKMFYFLFLSSSSFFFFKILLLLAPSSLLLSGSTKGRALLSVEQGENCLYYTLEAGTLLNPASSEHRECVGLRHGV